MTTSGRDLVSDQTTASSSVLFDMKKARPLTVPRGHVMPFGAILNVGKQILDVGCGWFLYMHVHGHTCGNFGIYRYMHHDVPPTDQPTLLDRAAFELRKLEALARLRAEFVHP